MRSSSKAPSKGKVRLLAFQTKAKGKGKATLSDSKVAVILKHLSILPPTTKVLVSTLRRVPLQTKT